jgi:2-polyprenyl-3-methyl-5-hydroxy-6-metoxy-1,4-benzoquinol methylase
MGKMGNLASRTRIEEVYAEVEREYIASPVDIFGNGLGAEESDYLRFMRPAYLRTLANINELFAREAAPTASRQTVLEIGCFLGAVSVTLSRLGFDVTAADLPDFLESGRLHQRLTENGCAVLSLNLRSGSIPLADESCDAVIMSEVLEHLNFNPVPVLNEINRVLKSGGFLYLTVPNLTSLAHRIQLLRGQSIHSPIDYYFRALEKGTTMCQAIHWREFTAAEIESLLGRLGFTIRSQSYHHYVGELTSRFPRRQLVRLIYRLFPHLLPNLVTVATKSHRSDFVPYYSDVNKLG